MAHGRHRPQRAVLGDLLGQGARSSGPTGVRPTAAKTASWRSGTWCSCSSRRTTRVQSHSAAQAVDRHRGRPGADPVGVAGQGLGVPDRRDGPPDRGGRGRHRLPAGGTTTGSDLALRVLAEHARTMTFLISDGVFPSNEDRGYVLRRIMRRAVRFAYLLGVNDLVTPRLVDAVVDIMGDDYPQLQATREPGPPRSCPGRRPSSAAPWPPGPGCSTSTCRSWPAGAESDGSSVAFLLHDTYGFPVEVTAEVVVGAGLHRRPGRLRDRDGGPADPGQGVPQGGGAGG